MDRQKVEKRISNFFIRGPIPGEWIAECTGIGLSATKIGLVLLYLRGVTKSDTVKLSTSARSLFLISPWHVSRTLKGMARSGLVEIEKSKRGAVPMVTLLLDKYYEPTANADSG